MLRYALRYLRQQRRRCVDAPVQRAARARRALNGEEEVMRAKKTRLIYRGGAK